MQTSFSIQGFHCFLQSSAGQVSLMAYLPDNYNLGCLDKKCRIVKTLKKLCAT